MYRHTHHRAPSRCLAALLLTGLVCLAALSAANAQQPYYITSDVPTLAGAMVHVRTEQPSLIVISSGGTRPTYRYINQPAGRFQIQTSSASPTGGNPTRTGDESAYLAGYPERYPDPAWGIEYTNKVIVAIDPTPPSLGQVATGVFQDPHFLAALRGTSTTPFGLLNFWPVPPAAGLRDITGTFRVPVDPVSTTSTHSQWISVQQRQTVIGDTVQIEYIVTNISTQSHRIGLRIVLDTAFGSFPDLDGRTIVLPDGRTISNETTLPDPTVSDDILPDSWVSYDSTSNPKVVLRGIVTGDEINNPGSASQSAGRPDTISFGQWPNIGAPEGMYYFTPNKQGSLIGVDWGYSVWWNARDLVPNQSRRYVTYYGIGASAANYEPPYALMGYAPFSLSPRAGDDPATPTVIEQYYLADDVGRSPFPLAAYMDNFRSNPILDGSVRIRLPEGLELASGETLSKSAGIIYPNEIKSVSWKVLATAARPGQVSIRYSGPQGKVVSRNMNIPATPVLNPLPNSSNGLEMVSIPYEFANSDAEEVFQSLISLLPDGPSTIIRYNPATAGYKWFPDPTTTAISPGMGFWLLNRNRTPVVMPDDATPVDTTHVYLLALKAGWNQIGNPFTSTIPLSQVRVAGTDGGDWSLDEAISRNMLLPTLYAYDPASNAYTWEMETADARLDPYYGYWILVRQDLTLMFPPPTMFTAAKALAPARVTPRATGPSNWKLDLSVSAPGLSPSVQSLAVRADATRGLDQYDVPEPPAGVKSSQLSLHSAFYPAASSTGTPYLVDSRGPSAAPQEWNLVIKTNAVNTPVTVSWPSLDALPSSLIATLVDETTGARRYMRTTRSYALQTGPEATERVLKIVVQPRPSQSLAVTSVQSAATGQGGLALTYTLSSAAAVDVRVRNIAGAVINELAVGREAAAGANTLLWNGRNARGNFVPSGRYLCEITARSPLTGQAVSVVHALQVQR